MADSNLIQQLLKAYNRITGIEGLQTGIGGIKHLVNSGLPDKVGFENGRIVVSDKDVTNPETTGSFISLPADATPIDRAHEFRHADQGDLLSGLMIPARAAEGVMDYGSGPLERDAYHRTEPNSEFLRKKPNAYTHLVESLLQAGLGK